MPRLRRLFPILLSGACASTPTDFDSRRTRYLDLMEGTESHCNEILEDVKLRRGKETVQGRLSAVQKNLEEARQLRYRRVETENSEMDEYFETFFLKLDQLASQDWTAGEGERLWDKLQFNCSICHGRFRD